MRKDSNFDISDRIVTRFNADETFKNGVLNNLI